MSASACLCVCVCVCVCFALLQELLPDLELSLLLRLAFPAGGQTASGDLLGEALNVSASDRTVQLRAILYLRRLELLILFCSMPHCVHANFGCTNCVPLCALCIRTQWAVAVCVCVCLRVCVSTVIRVPLFVLTCVCVPAEVW